MSVYTYGRSIPEFVRKFRDDLSLSQADLGEMLGVHGQYISNIERGEMISPVSFCKKLIRHIKDEQRRAHLVDLIADAKAQEVGLAVYSCVKKQKSK